MIEAEFYIEASNTREMMGVIGDIYDRAYDVVYDEPFHLTEDRKGIYTNIWVTLRDERHYDRFTDWLYAFADVRYAEVGDIVVKDESGRVIRNHL